MAVFKNVRSLSGASAPVVEYDVKSGAAATVKVGYPVKKDGGNAGYVTLSANGDTSFLGIAASESTDTATADGKVLIYVDPAGLRFNGVATTPSNLAQALKTTKVTIDLSGSSFTVDENDVTNGFMQLVDYDNATDGNCDMIASSTL